jgi:hypothetical protein
MIFQNRNTFNFTALNQDYCSSVTGSRGSEIFSESRAEWLHDTHFLINAVDVFSVTNSNQIFQLEWKRMDSYFNARNIQTFLIVIFKRIYFSLSLSPLQLHSYLCC